MTNIYLYQDQTIGIYEHKIDLLRNGYNYDIIEYPDIKGIVIHKGLIRKWFLLFALGSGCLILAFFLIQNVYNNSSSGNFWINFIFFWRGSKGSGLIAVIFLLAFGFYSIIISLSKKILMTIDVNNTIKQFEITNIFKDQKFKSLISFLRDKVSNLVVDKSINID